MCGVPSRPVQVDVVVGGAAAWPEWVHGVGARVRAADAARRWRLVFRDAAATSTRQAIFDSPARGAIVGSISRPAMEGLARRARRGRGIPVVAVEAGLCDLPPGSDLRGLRAAEVLPDGGAIGRLAAEHLLERGLDRYAFFGFDAAWSLARERGFTRRLREAGVEDGAVVVRHLRVATARLTVGRFARRLRDRTGLLAAADWLAVPSLEALRAGGCRGTWR